MRANKTKQRRQMLEYIVEKLSLAGERAEPVEKNILGSFVSRYIKVEPSGIVLLADRAYGCDNFKRFVSSAKAQFEKVAIVFLKDGNTFWRSAAKKAHFKANGRSLKYYDENDVFKMLSLRPEEKYAVHASHTGELQYFQPESQRLDESIVQVEFGTINFDYSHIEGERYHPRNTTSKKLYLWKNRKEHDGPLILARRKLEFSYEQQERIAQAGEFCKA
ncbi:hypothetical protein D6825_01350 [Candidatus Woesearchaeota archaeon]|nr:MAG: hypothetical protein D6825_01350 [Candidatus Woesearchaeota archaeon]